MMVCRLVFAAFLGNCFLLLLLSSLIDANQANVDCLRTIKSQVEDPKGYLSSWDFRNQTAAGFICKFSGVTCWHDDENRVLSIKLSGYGLRGAFPQGIKRCSDMTGLELSRNNFSGPLPSNIFSLIPLVTYLDLSYNSFSGEIPMLISNLTFLNTLLLQHNQFTGSLPPQLAQLGRLKAFSVADNRLVGPIPNFNQSYFGADLFQNNLDLCGNPLDDCKSPSIFSGKVKSPSIFSGKVKSPSIFSGKVVIIAALGGVTVSAFVVGIIVGLLFCSSISVERLLFKRSR